MTITSYTKGFDSSVSIFGYRYNPYRFAFNSQEKTDEIAGAGNHNTALFWEYDTRTGRRWNRDPKPTVGISDYACFGGNPISISDVLGDIVDPTNEKSQKKLEKDRKENPKFNNLVGKMDKLQDIVCFTNDKSEFEKNTNVTIPNDGSGSIGFTGSNYWVYAEDNEVTEQKLGTSTSIEEFVHLDRIFRGVDKFEKGTSDWGIPGWNNKKEAEDKFWVVKNINIHSYYPLIKDNITYLAPTHYGIMKLEKMDAFKIENFLNSKGILNYEIYQKPSDNPNETQFNTSKMKYDIIPGYK